MGLSSPYHRCRQPIASGSKWLRMAAVVLAALLLHACAGEKKSVPEITDYEQVRNSLFLRGNLESFYASLHELERKSPGNDTVRVMFFGDSVIWGDCLTVRMKRRFHEQFGDGGRGLLRFVDWAPTRLMDHRNLTRGGYERLKIPFESFSIPDFPDLGFTGFSHRPRGNAPTIHATSARTPISDVRRYQSYQSRNPALPEIQDTGPPLNAKYGTDGESWTRVRFILRRGNGDRSRIDLKYTTEEGTTGSQSHEMDLSKGHCEILEMEIPPSRRVEARFSGSPLIDGMAVERGPGVSFSAIVLRGLHQSWLLGVPENQFACGYRAFDPRLIIFQFGINESQTMHYAVQGFSPEVYESQLRRFYTRLKKAVPNASILILGPWERLLKQGGYYQTYSAHETVREIQKRVAFDMGLAYFDGFIFLEGTEGLRKAVRNGLIQSDYTHVTYPGGHYMADALYNKLMEDYRLWKEGR